MSEAAEARKPGRWARIKAEFKKIIWPSRESAAKQTIAVIVVSVILGIIIALLDSVFKYGVGALIGL
ncbi:MAG: preprotein translocase subunit SecE [Lachnospiraceae bacterium]|nr:preprotein translocase subunit SecE [Lachnospiraceae bacterium]